MAIGIVKRLPNVQNYGFVIPEGTTGEEIFFHRTAVADDGFDELRQGQRVRFEIVPDPRNATKQQAVKVEPADSAS